MSFHLLFKAVYQEVRPVRGTVRQTKTGKIVPVQGYAAKKLVSGNGEEEFEKKQKYIEAAKRTIDEKPEERRDDSAGMAFRDAVTKMAENEKISYSRSTGKWYILKPGDSRFNNQDALTKKQARAREKEGKGKVQPRITVSPKQTKPKMPEEGRRETWSDVRAKKIREGKDIQSATAAADFLLSQGVAREDFPQQRATNPRGKNQNV